MTHNKNYKQFLFEVQLNWINGQQGVLSARDAEGSIHVATPPSFGGEGKPWTPEHLFLSSISSCFMSTFLAFAKKTGLSIDGFDCAVIGQIHLQEGRYRFTGIDLFPKITIHDESLRDKAKDALEKTHRYCIITNSVSTPIFYHSEIYVPQQTVINNL